MRTPWWIALSQRDAKAKSRSDQIRSALWLSVYHRVRRTRSTFEWLRGRRRRAIQLIGVIGCLLAQNGSIPAQDIPTITITKGDKINLTVSPISGSDGATATKTLQNDLTRSGYFVLSGNAAYIARGTASGGSLQGQVVDHSGGTVLSKGY